MGRGRHKANWLSNFTSFDPPNEDDDLIFQSNVFDEEKLKCALQIDNIYGGCGTCFNEGGECRLASVAIEKRNSKAFWKYVHGMRNFTLSVTLTVADYFWNSRFPNETRKPRFASSFNVRTGDNPTSTKQRSIKRKQKLKFDSQPDQLHNLGLFKWEDEEDEEHSFTGIFILY